MLIWVIVFSLLVLSFIVRLLTKPISFSSQEKSVSSVSKTVALVLPHHDLLINEFPTFYSYSISDKPVTKIIFLSPNHFQPESLVGKTTELPFLLPDDQKVVVQKNIANLFPERTVVADAEVYKNEHGILLHLPFIAKKFPNAEILPILLTRNISKDNLKKIIVALKSQINENTLIIVSTDFSHDLKFEEAEKKDQEVLELIQKNDSEKIVTLGDEYLDCPSCMYVLLHVLQGSVMNEPEVLFHSNSARYLELTPDEPTTSYFVLRW